MFSLDVQHGFKGCKIPLSKYSKKILIVNFHSSVRHRIKYNILDDILMMKRFYHILSFAVEGVDYLDCFILCQASLNFVEECK